MIRSILLFYSLFFSVSQLCGQNIEQVNYTYDSYPNDPLGTRKYVLKNGLTVFTSVNTNEPRIYTCIAIAAGSKHDPKNNTGLAHYLEHMLFKGTDLYGTSSFEKEQGYLKQIESLYEKYNKSAEESLRKQLYRRIDSLSSIAANIAIANEYDKMMQFIGAKGTNAYTSFDETVYINDIPSNQFDAWLKIEAERFRNPVYRLFHTELEAVYEEKNMSLDSDSDKLYETMMQALFKNHAYGLQTTIGKSEHLKNPSLKAIRNFYEMYYVPNNMAICLAGNFNPDEIIEKIDAAFSLYKPVNISEPQFNPEKKDTTAEYLTVKGPEQESVSLAFRFPKLDALQCKMLELISELLYNGTTGLMDRNLLNSQKILSGYSETMNLRDYSVLILNGEPQKEQKLPEINSLLLAQIDSLRKGKVTDEQIRSAVLNLKTREERMIENSSSRAFEMVDLFVKRFDLKSVHRRDSLFDLLTKKELIRFVRDNLQKDFVVVYKQKDESFQNAKIEKPEITPVPLNRKDNSAFASSIYNQRVASEKPQFINFKQSIKSLNIGNAITGYYVKNTSNNLFKYQVILEFGRIANPYLPFAIDLFQLSGTPKYSNQQIKELFYALACNYSMSVGEYTTTIELSGPQKSFSSAIGLLENWILHPVLEKETLRLFVNSKLQERENMLSNPEIIRSALNNYALYGEKNPFSRQLTNKQLKALKNNILNDHVSTLFSYPHKISYYGPDDINMVENQIKENHIAQVTLTIPERELFKPINLKKSKVYFADFNMVQATISWLAAGSGIDTANFATASLYNEYFGGGMSSIVFQEIRESKALAYSAYSYFRNPVYTEGFETSGAFIGTQADKIDSAIVAMNDLLRKMPLSENLFLSSKTALLSSIENDRISPRNYAGMSMAYTRQGIEYDFRKSVYRSLHKLNLKDIVQFHQNKIANTTYALAVVGSSKRIDKTMLSKFGAVESVSVQKLLGFR